MKKAYSMFLVFVLVLSARATGVGNGLYFNIDNSIWSGHEYYAEKVGYACNRDIQYTYLAKGAGLVYCSENVTVAIVYRERDEIDDVGQFSLVFNEEVKMDDDEATHCAEGTAVVWDVKRGPSGNYASARESCKEIPDTSDDSDETNPNSSG